MIKVHKKKSYKRIIAFLLALTTIASLNVVTGFTAKNNDREIVNHVDDYTSLFPTLTDNKMKLSDPVFTEKDWYEYIEYEFFNEIVDGDMTYRIYKPSDFSAASIMAITDYDPKKGLDMGGGNITMNLGELQGIFDMAQQGGNISKDFAGLNIATGIANNMNDIGDVMENAKYYSNTSFLGIPGDSSYTGVSNAGFFNNDSFEISITETETISVCKTVAIDSNYSVAQISSSSKDFSSYNEIGSASTNTLEESESHSNSDTSGRSIGSSVTNSEESVQTISNSIASSLETEVETSIINTIGTKIGWEAGMSGTDTNFGATALASGEVSTELQMGITASVAAGLETSNTTENSKSIGKSSEQSIEENLEKTKTEEHSVLKSNSIENSLVNGTQNGKSEENGQEISASIGYGVDYQFGNENSLSCGVTRVFNARDDKEVKNVGWKLCEYIVKVPYYIEAVKTDAAGEETVLYGQYVNYNLLNGVCRVFANGYIEHWYTGELVTYADFFDGFVTASELIDTAKAQQAEKADSIG